MLLLKGCESELGLCQVQTGIQDVVQCVIEESAVCWKSAEYDVGDFRRLLCWWNGAVGGMV